VFTLAALADNMTLVAFAADRHAMPLILRWLLPEQMEQESA